MLDQTSPADSPLPFRLWNPEQSDRLADGPTLKWTLRGLYVDWFAPNRDKKASEGTKLLRMDLLKWWEQLTSNPPLWAINEELIEQFAEALSQATYSRSKLGQGKETPLSVYTQRKLLANLRTLLNSIGPQRSRKNKTLHLIADPPLVELPEEEEGEPKAHLPIKTARAMVRSLHRLHWPQPKGSVSAPPAFSCGEYVYAYLCLLYFLGFRDGTIKALRWSMIQFRRGAWWIKVPSSDVGKTHKGRWKFLHPEAVEALEAIRTSDPRLLACPYGKKWHDKQFERLQEFVGVPKEDLLSVQALRRTHAHIVEHVGRRKMGEKLAQLALDHSDAKTTRRNYLANEHKILKRLPRLVRKKKTNASDQQLTLF